MAAEAFSEKNSLDLGEAKEACSSMLLKGGKLDTEFRADIMATKVSLFRYSV